ncbi:MAG: phosphatidylglycerophosphatase A [Desulfuromonadaceae bacterium]|nr:phosphatidylglycerophosphatase A [Desulfuromonadaceae bacterium]
MRSVILLLASNLGLGYAPVAPGTFGTLAGIPCFWLLADRPMAFQAGIYLALLAISCQVAHRAGRIYRTADDGRIVIDELMGYLTTVLFLPFSWPTAVAAFVLFRVFDITKPPPVSTIDRMMKNGLGVVLDDVAAGIYAAATLRIGLWLLAKF